MRERIAAEAAIEVGHHVQEKWFGMTVNVDTVLATAIAAVIVLVLAFILRAKVTSTGVPAASSCSGRPSPSRCATRSRAPSG